MFFWADGCATQYEFIAVNGQTTTWISQGSVARVLRKLYLLEKLYLCTSIFVVMLPRIIQIGQCLQSYSKNNTASVFWPTVYMH